MGIMETTLGLVYATDENVGKVLPGLENAAANTRRPGR